MDPPAKKMPLPPYGLEESDDEGEDVDEVQLKKEGEKPVSPVKVVVVKDVAYATYWAVLHWIKSREIAFAPLLSTFRNAGRSRLDALPLRSANIALPVDSLSSVPPVSPRSVCRLAHYLGLEDLARLALDEYKSQLTRRNAAYELYSDVATFHPELRDVVIAYVVENWDTVATAAATEEMEEKALSGELDAATAGTLALLMKKLRPVVA